MFRSKRFVAFVIAVLLFTSMVFFTKYAPLELASSISMICGIYIGAESLRGSHPDDSRSLKG